MDQPTMCLPGSFTSSHIARSQRCFFALKKDMFAALTFAEQCCQKSYFGFMQTLRVGVLRDDVRRICVFFLTLHQDL